MAKAVVVPTAKGSNVVEVAVPVQSNNRTVKYQNTGLNQSKGFIDIVRNSFFTPRNKKLVAKEYMEAGGKYGEAVIPSKQAVSGILRSIKSECELKMAKKVATLVDSDYSYLLANQNEAFKNAHPEFYTSKVLTDTNKKALNDLVFEQTMYSIQTNMIAKIKG